MLVLRGARELLLDLAVGEAHPASFGTRTRSFDYGATRSASVTAIYENENPPVRQPPNIIIVGTGSLEDFFAWTSTYLPQWFPLSAISTVVSHDNPVLLDLLTFGVSRSYCEYNFRRGLAGLSLAEAILEMQHLGRQRSPSLLSGKSTYSYVAGHALCRYGRLSTTQLFDEYVRVNRTLSLPARTVPMDVLRILWDSLMIAMGTSGPSSAAADEATAALVEAVLGEDEVAITLIDNASVRVVWDRIRRRQSRKEDLMQQVEHVARELYSGSGRSPSWVGIVVALLVSELSSGPLSHWEPLGQISNWNPESMLWYGFVSAYRNRGVGDVQLESLLVRLTEELGQSANVRRDISARELEVVGSDARAISELALGTSLANVELIPGVSAPIRLSRSHGDTPTTRTPKTSLQRDSADALEQIISALRELFQDAHSLPTLFSDLPTSKQARELRKRRSKDDR